MLLDEVPREHALEFIAGSHESGKMFQRQAFNGNPLNEADGLETLPDINANCDTFNIGGWALTLDDAVAFEYRTVYSAQVNNSPSAQRRAFSLRLVGDGAIFARPEGKRRTRHHFPMSL